ncbi:MAG: acyl-CoA synthetase [Thermobacillus sp. ZCTH02-B1]|uniref:DUF4387 domain-containing protein n=1 Tax=Thermobacillus sp. ZCTH02-B1 TaxID=1858795 RepID=UPI000B569236|nr:DUF4387 domain-containing protein [Thermobacillus sp. ZCTH02-B1]OUM97158.1 MAG: acyl-CoA synthetase [Thermobacillus sp. ZCTH02-B1]
MAKLGDIARVIRSKNAGPFEITLDCLFDNREHYERVKRSNAITRETIARLYRIREDQVHRIVFYDQALGFKVTIARDASSGSAGDRDVYGAQQHAPLMNLDVTTEEGGGAP